MKPAFIHISPVNIDGIQTNRLMIVLKTKGCEYAKKTGGCTICGFLNHAKKDITNKEVLSQLDFTLKDKELKDIKEIDLLTLGSFYNDNESSENFRKTALKKISKLKNIIRVSTESRAEYVTIDKLKKSKKILGNKIFELGIGLESSNDYIRNKIIKKSLTKKAFENLIVKIKKAEINLLVYLLIKPQYLSEKTAIKDAIKSAKYVFKISKKKGVKARVAFEPVFICKNTPLTKLYENKDYKLVNLWSIIKVILKVTKFGPIFVGLSDENLSKDRMPDSCPKCSKKIKKAIENFNKTQDITELKKLNCECKKDYKYKLNKGLI
jgi:archaeosine synthase beta-subunit